MKISPKTRTLSEIIDSLSDLEYTVLSLLLGLNETGVTMTRSEIARLLKTTPTRIATIVAKGYQKLSDPTVESAIKNFLELYYDD